MKVLDWGKGVIWGFSMAVIFMIIVMAAVLSYVFRKQRKLELTYKLTLKRCEYQKNYYERIISNDEEIRGFRHDIRKHMSTLAVLCEKKSLQEIKKYIGELSENLNNMTMCYTGNLIADYFINEAIEELKTSGRLDFSITGRFPDTLHISDTDLCVLLGNAVENARDALLNCEGDRKLVIEIKTYKGRLFFNIANSVNEEKYYNFLSSKSDRQRHGYGIKNMEKVTKKYGGRLEYTIEHGMCAVHVEV